MTAREKGIYTYLINACCIQKYTFQEFFQEGTNGMNDKEARGEKTNDGTTVFGMTKDEILSLADARTEQKDTNRPANSGSYADFVKTAVTGRERLVKGGYCKKQQ